MQEKKKYVEWTDLSKKKKMRENKVIMRSMWL